jgi:hypothetical protein
MTPFEQTQYLERRQFFDWERLFAADLNDAETNHRQMRWLHNQSLHQPGVGNGFKVTGVKGAREVQLGPGYALDAAGHEIVLVRATTLPVPPVADDGNGRPMLYYLAVSYPDELNLVATEYRRGICGNSGAVRLAERPTLCWVQLQVDDPKKPTSYVPKDPNLHDQITAGMLIVLAMVGVFQCQLTDNIVGPWLVPRRSALPPPLPYTASGIQKQTFWNLTPIDPIVDLLLKKDPTSFPCWLLAPLTLGTVVDQLTGANFGAIPRYLVRISGSRVFPATLNPTDQTGLLFIEPVIDLALDQNQTNHLKFTLSISLMVYIKDSTTWAAARGPFFLVRPPNGATDGSLVPVDDPQAAMRNLADFLGKSWQIVWVGIEG